MLKSNASMRAIISWWVITILSLTTPVAKAGPPKLESQLALKPIERLTNWFPKLVASFDGFVDVEQKKQFRRRVQALAREIRKLENKKLEFSAFLKTAPQLSDEQLRKGVSQYATDLETWLLTTRDAIIKLADVLSGPAGKDGRAAADRLSEMLQLRESQHRDIQVEKEKKQINVALLQKNNLAGMQNLRAAREALGTLLNHIESRPSP